MRVTKLIIALAVALSTSAVALEPVKGDDRAFRFTPEDVADVALFLCSPLAQMIHGQTLTVDGGYNIVA